MMKKNLAFILLASVLGMMLSACEQDPMAKMAAEIQNAKSVDNMPQKPEPVEWNAIRFDVPDAINFAETVRGNFTVSAKVFKEGYEQVTLEIENLEEFEGATHDAAAGEFVWTPKKGTVRIGDHQQFNLSLRAFAKPKDPKGLILTKPLQVRIDVNRTFMTPTITKIDNFPRQIREEEVKTFFVEVVDFDSGADVNDVPIVQFIDSARSVINMSSTVQLLPSGMQFFPNEKRWRFQYEMSLKGIEATPNSTLFYLGVRVVNKFGIVSTKNELEGRIYTRLSQPDTNWDPKITLKPEVAQTITFLIYDPKAEAVLQYKEATYSGPAGATLVCNGSQVKICDFTVTPKGKVDAVDYQFFKFDIESSNKDYSDTGVDTKHFYLYFYVDKIPAQPIVSEMTGALK